jgi:hypothetical protein
MTEYDEAGVMITPFDPLTDSVVVSNICNPIS